MGQQQLAQGQGNGVAVTGIRIGELLQSGGVDFGAWRMRKLRVQRPFEIARLIHRAKLRALPQVSQPGVRYPKLSGIRTIE
jgi:hypothetical protein